MAVSGRMQHINYLLSILLMKQTSVLVIVTGGGGGGGLPREKVRDGRRLSEGSRVGAVVRALAFHQCVLGSIPGPGVICGLSLLVLYSSPRGFSPGTPVFPSPEKPAFDLICLIYLI